MSHVQEGGLGLGTLETKAWLDMQNTCGDTIMEEAFGRENTGETKVANEQTSETKV